MFVGEVRSHEHLVFACACAGPNLMRLRQELVAESMDEILTSPRKLAILYKLTDEVPRA